MGQQPLLGAARPGHAAAVPGGLCVCVFRGRVVGSAEGAGLRRGSPRGEAGRGAPPGGRAGGFWAGPARPCRPPPPHPTPFTPPAAPGPCCLSWGRFSRGSFSALPVAAVPCRPGAVPPTLRRLAFQEQDKQGAQGGAPPTPPFSAGQGRGGMLGVVPLPPPSSVSRNDLVSLWWGSGVWPRPPPACPAVCNSVVCHENDRAAQPAACLFFSIPLAPGGA